MLFANALVPRARGQTKKLRKRGPRLRSLGNERDLMFRFIAFLRAINVGRGRTVEMQSLRQIFQHSVFLTSLRSSPVETLCLRRQRNGPRRLKERLKKR